MEGVTRRGEVARDARRATRDARRRALGDANVRAEHRRHRPGLWLYFWQSSPATLAAAPLVYSLIIPFALLDGWVTLFQAVCFRAWRIRPVRRPAFLIVDRHKLAYLNGVERLNCTFCGYTNGVIAYVREVAARTEQYWCPIRHAHLPRSPHERYRAFVPYGDLHAYRHDSTALREELKP